jgi:hypothetical protein
MMVRLSPLVFCIRPAKGALVGVLGHGQEAFITLAFKVF